MGGVPQTAELVVVGGGVAGAATAFHAARAGLRPLIVEARPALCTLTTPVATGAFRLQFDNPEEIALVRESVELFLHFAERDRADGTRSCVRQQGYLFATTSAEGRRGSARWSNASTAGGWTTSRCWTATRFAGGSRSSRPEVIQARFRAGDGLLDPKALTLGLAKASGRRRRARHEVTGFAIVGGRLNGVETTRARSRANGAVIACGPLSGAVARWRVELPVETVRRHKLVFAELPEVPPDAPMTIDDDTGTHWRPFLRGAALLCTDPLTEPSPPTDRVPLDPASRSRCWTPRAGSPRPAIVPFWRAVWERGAPAWFLQAGQYTMSPDRRPLVGETPVPGLWVNTGYSGHGVMGSGGREPHPRRRHDRPPARRGQSVSPRSRVRRARPRYALRPTCR